MRSRRDCLIRHIGLTLSAKRKRNIFLPLPEVLRQLESSKNWNSPITIGNRFSYGLDALTFSTDDRFATMLIGCIDGEAREAAYKNIDNGTIRPQPMKENEGGAASAHLVIRLEGSSSGPAPSYPAVMEQTENCSRGQIQVFLNKLFEKSCVFTYKGTEVQPFLHLDIYHDRTISDQADETRLLAVRFRQRRGDVDAANRVQVTHEIKMKVPSGKGYYHARTFIQSALDLFRTEVPVGGDDYAMLLRLQRPGNAGETTLEVPMSPQDALAESFQKVDVIAGFDEALPSATSSINDVLAQKMARVLCSRPQ